MQPHSAPMGQKSLRILCLGDVVGRPGRRALAARLPGLRRKLNLDLVIANGENAAGGIGLTPDTLREMFGAGVDVVTSGNHVWKHREMRPCLDKEARVLRPENYGPEAPGRGFGVFVLPGGERVGVLNLLGRVYMDPVDNPFAAADRALNNLQEQAAGLVIVDFHAEASSEKRAMAHYLDGRVALVVGTHTHVQTADAHITDKGTACISDLGMCGVEFDSVIGMGKAAVLKRFTRNLPEAFGPAKGRVSLNGLLTELDPATGRALAVTLFRDCPATVLDAG
ncbi:YmdB family metallophosphoesterase [Desulfovibrio sp. OttesenSCG-928-M16]|nr:YmdB family metallophosphoesterase [Desulfovibrio sp. OttesenSCG-928-M16]